MKFACIADLLVANCYKINSRGEEWSERGFGWIAYGNNSIGLYLDWVQPTPTTEAQ